MAGPLGSTPGIIVGVGVGTAAATALEPAIELARQKAWQGNAHRILDPATMARLVAQGGVPLETAVTSNQRDGFSADKTAALVYLAQTVPGFGEALTLYRRDPQGFADLWSHALTKNGLDARYLPHLNELVDDRLSPPVIALAIVRGIMHDPGFLPVGPPTATGKVQAFPVSGLDALKEAQAHGFDRDRLFVQTAIMGRPMSPEAAALAVFKGILERVDYDRAVAEGDVRNEWAEAIFENTRPIISPADAAGLWLRGWKTEAEAYALGAKHGATPEVVKDLYLNRGRPATPRQIHLGYARGAKYLGENLTEAEAIARGVKQSDIRPEWEAIEAQNVWTYPSPFVLRGLAQSGALTQAQVHQILIEEGWKEEYATATAAFWATGGAAKTKGETKGELAEEYIAGFMDEAEYRAALTGLGITGHEQDLEVLHAEVAAIKTARGAQVTKLRNAYDKGEITQAVFAGSLAALGMHDIAVQREVDYANVYRNAVGITG